MAEEKLAIESGLIMSQPSKDYEETWLENITNHGIFVLYSVCQNKDCKARCRPVLIPYHLYRQRLVTASTIINYDDGFPPMRCIIDNCNTCRTKGSVYILDSFVNVRRCTNPIPIPLDHGLVTIT